MRQPCVPCQGIERLTPLPIFNRAGLTRLQYRVGQYPEFFQSALAALSDAPPGADPREVLDRTLDRLRTRDSDDPSIALLDAWAIVADVLTFYQERIANEAFLNTATRPGSLHELSRLLGYAPRPGLSSSVLLSFRVDERSDEVIIPMGTPAKSTPLPGTPDQPQTFETSEPFVARADWNAIRPRLTRPQTLRQEQLADVERIYVRGTGLRIGPNDRIAIGDSDRRVATLKQVERVEERSDTEVGAITVLYLVGDALSPRRLLAEFASEAELFFTVSRSSPVLDPSEFDSHKRRFTTAIQGYLNDIPEGLSHIDSELQTDLIEGEILVQMPAGPLRGFIDGILTKATSIANQYPMDTATSKYHLALEAYKTKHGTAKNTLTPWKTAITALTGVTTPAHQLAMKRALGAATLGAAPETQPTLVHGMNLAPEVAMGNPAFPGLSVAGFNPASPPAGDFQVEFELTEGLTLSTTSIMPQSLTNLVTAWAGVTRTSAVGAFSDFILFTVKDDGGAFVAAGVQEIRGPGGTEAYFKGVLPYRTLVNKKVGATYRVDLDVILGLPGTVPAGTTFSLTAQILEGDGALSWGAYVPGSPIAKDDLNLLTGAINDARFTPNHNMPQRVTIRFTLNADGKPKFQAVRTLIIDHGASYVRQQLAESSSNASELAELKVTLNDTDAALLAVNADSITRMHTAVAENEKLPNDALLTAELGLSDVNTTLNGKLEVLRSELIALSQAGLDLTRITTAAAALVQNPVTTGKTTEYDSELEKVSAEITAFKVSFDATELQDKLFRFANAMKRSLHNRRSRFADLLKGASDDNAFAFSESGEPQGSEVKDALDELFAEAGANSLSARVEELDQLTLDATHEPADLPDDSKISELEALAKTADDELTDEDLEGEAERAAVRIIERWRRVFAAVGERALPNGTDLETSSDIDEVRDILQQIAAGALTLDSARASLVFDVLQTQSQLWTQVTAALNPNEEAQILASLRAFRNVESRKVSKPHVWVFRSQANLFGWNSPGKLEPYSSDVDQLVLKRDSTALVPDETDNIAFLDGKFEQTSENGVIAIQRPTSAEPTPYWIAEVRFTPRTAYELSGDTTKVTLDQAWWPLPDSPSHTDFATIRGTRVWCDTEELELVEALFQDDSTLFSVSVEPPQLALELNKFCPSLSAGSLIVVSGIAAPERLTPDTVVPKRDDAPESVLTELVTITGVNHDFDENLYGDAVRTTVQLARPLTHDYWRNTVEINANVVPATHGETVRQTLGSGDARRSFQKFMLSSPPLTRLPAADADGQEPELKVRVNNVLWDGVDRLLDEDGPTETYQVRAQRTGEELIQFGDGGKGSRVPTGQENVRAVYRAGLGLAGNVAAGRIDQLPAPPLGVSSVSNPIPGDGGADPDTVAQSKLRTPRAPIRAGRLISARDYESFALLFAGVDKAAAIEEHGGLRLTVAGMTPGPLREDGALMQSLNAALKRFGDPNVPVTVHPHVGQLLYVEARLNINERADWETVKAAVRAAILRRFGYGFAKLGRDILASDVVATMQGVQHVQAIRLNKLSGFTTADTQQPKPGEKVTAQARVRVNPNELCYVADTVDNTIVLVREL